MTTKGDLLEKYASREPRSFIQFDGYAKAPDIAVSYRPDEDGDLLGSTITTELIDGGFTVRVLIAPEISQRTALRLLKKIRRRLKYVGWERSDMSNVEVTT